MRRTTLRVATVLVAAGCTTARGTPSVDPAAQGLTWVAHLNASRVVGTRLVGDVRITPSVTKPDGSHIVIQVTGAETTTRYPWVIASGTCVDLIPVDLGGRAMYPQLDIRNDGTGRLTVDLPIVVPIDQRYHLALFTQASPTQEESVAACGELAIANSR